MIPFVIHRSVFSLLNKGKKHSLVLHLSGSNSENCILFQRVVFKKKTIENYKKNSQWHTERYAATSLL
jgi:hypothetical protein